MRIAPPRLGPEFVLLGTPINRLADRLEKVEDSSDRAVSITT